MGGLLGIYNVSDMISRSRHGRSEPIEATGRYYGHLHHYCALQPPNPKTEQTDSYDSVNEAFTDFFSSSFVSPNPLLFKGRAGIVEAGVSRTEDDAPVSNYMSSCVGRGINT